MPSPPVTLVRFADPAAFHERVVPFLLQHEAEHNLLLGIAGQLAARPDAWGGAPYQAVIEAGADGEIVAVAQRTPPFNVVLSRIDEAWLAAAVDAFVADLRHAQPDLAGVLAPTRGAEAFATAWTGGAVAWRVNRAERIFELREVVAPRGVPGAMRRATASDRERIARWMVAFGAEALDEEDTLEEVLAVVDRWRQTGSRTMWLWEDGGTPVSMAGTSGPTPNGIRVGPVYTPPELRGRGYASALTAAVSQHELEAGRRFCFLFTDLANPTSNHIYGVVGYRPVADVSEIRFVPG